MIEVRFTVPPDLRYYSEYAIATPPEMQMDTVPRIGDTVVILMTPGLPQRVGLIVKDVYWEITDPEDPYVMVILGEMSR
jgi:hypothetical protein